MSFNKAGNQEFAGNVNQNTFYNYNYNFPNNPNNYNHNNFNQNLNFSSNNYMFPQQQYGVPNYFGGGRAQYNQFSQYPQNKNFYGNNNNNFNNKNNLQQQNQVQVDEASLLESLKYVAEKYPHLVKLNQSYAGLTQRVKNQLSPRFFVIKSFTEEDIHKVSHCVNLVN